MKPTIGVPHFPALVCAAFVVLCVLWPMTRRVLRAIAARRALSALARYHLALEPSRDTGRPARHA